MATINASSVEKAKQDLIPISLLTPEELKGRIRISKTTYTWLTGYLDIGSTVTGALLPKGARIVNGYLFSQAGVASSTLQVSINAVVLSAAIALGATALRAEIPDAANWHNIVGVDFGGYAPVITTAGAAMVAGAKLALILEYVVD